MLPAIDGGGPPPCAERGDSLAAVTAPIRSVRAGAAGDGASSLSITDGVKI